jgi:hypothetical protein
MLPEPKMVVTVGDRRIGVHGAFPDAEVGHFATQPDELVALAGRVARCIGDRSAGAQHAA